MKPVIKCPNCGSSTVRSRKAIYMSGTSVYSGNHSTSGLSFGLGKNVRPRFWFGGGRHSGTRQSLLAQEASPFPIFPGIVFSVIIFIFFNSGLAILFATCWIAFSLFINTETFDKEWICSKCAHKFAPKRISLDPAFEQGKKLTNEASFLLCAFDNWSDIKERKKAATKLLKILRELKKIEKHYLVIDFHNTQERVTFFLKTVDVLAFLDKADKEYLAGNKKNEIKYLLEALHLLITNRIKINEFNSLLAKSEITGENWTINNIKKRLLNAGYTPPK